MAWFGGGALFRQARSLAEQGPALQQQLRQWEAWLQARTGIDIEPVVKEAGVRARAFLLDIDGRQVIGQAQTVLEFGLLTVVLVIGALFALARPNDQLMVPLLRAVPRAHRAGVRRVLELLGKRLLGWVKAQIIAMVAVGALVTLALWLIGVPYALLLGAISMVTEFIPILGPWIGAIPAVVIAFMDDPAKGMWTMLAMLVIQQIESNVVTPLAMSKAAKVHPFVTLFALLFFGTLFGFLGVLLAVPLVLLVWTVVQVLWVERGIRTNRDHIEPVVEE